MNHTLLIYISFVVFSSLTMCLLFIPQVKKYIQTLNFKYYMFPFPYMFFIYAMGAIGAYFLVDNKDFIEPLTLKRVLIPLALTAIIYVSSLFVSQLFFSALVLGCVSVTVFLQPISKEALFLNIPIMYEQLIVIAFITIFCLCFKILNSVAHTIVIPSILILVGYSVFSMLGAAPVYTALCSAMLIGVLFTYLSINFNEVKIDLDDGACCAIAFLISNILLLNLGEFNFVSGIIFTLPFWCELAIAIWNRVIVTKYGTLMENTNYFEAAGKLTPKVLALNISKVGIVCLFLGWFQLFSTNQYSLLIVSVLVTFWLNDAAAKTLKRATLREINEEFVENLKQNMTEVKNIISGSSNESEDK